MPEGKRRPWWAVAIAGGFGAVLGVATLFGLIGNKARGEEKPMHIAAAALTSAGDETARWRERMEQKIDALTEKVAHIEGRLEKR